MQRGRHGRKPVLRTQLVLFDAVQAPLCWEVSDWYQNFIFMCETKANHSATGLRFHFINSGVTDNSENFSSNLKDFFCTFPNRPSAYLIHLNILYSEVEPDAISCIASVWTNKQIVFKFWHIIDTSKITCRYRMLNNVQTVKVKVTIDLYSTSSWEPHL